MHGKERTAVMSIASIMAFRMLGLFMILPVFAVQAQHLTGASVALIGVALGVYGLTQALLQMPFGALSDQIGRKPIIMLGLSLFVIGSIICALAHSIELMILGRALQGAGAIGSTALAMVADLTRDEHRSKAMAMIGLTIGFSFTLALIIGPIINSAFHFSGIFWLSAVLGVIGMILLAVAVPTPPRLIPHQNTDSQTNRFKPILKNRQLSRLDAGIFSLHAILTAMFIAVPILFTQALKLTEFKQVMLYLSIMILAFITAVPFIIIAEKKRKMKSVFVAAILTIVFTELLLLFMHQHTATIVVALLLFFCAFTLLEATLPSLVSKISPIRNKGTAMGIYSTSQFFGIFVGGSLGGLIFSHFHAAGIFSFCALLGLAWFSIAFTMAEPPYLSTIIFETADKKIDELQVKLAKITGIAEIVFMPDENLIYFKIDKKIITEHELRKLVEGDTLNSHAC